VLSSYFEPFSSPIRFTKSVVTGIAASVVDMALLVVLVEWFHISPPTANLPALIIGSAIQFLGNRHVVFDFEHKVKLHHQMTLFALTEGASFALNAGAFYLVIHGTRIPYFIARPVISLCVFAGFSFPVWGRIFREKKD
jgi:putative flippase GtrA